MPLARAHGGPVLTGVMRTCAEDFQVVEQLGFEPEGFGEHVFLEIEKRDANTEWVARSLASALKIAPVAIGYSGLKDRHALTRQTFSVHLPGKADPDWSTIMIEGVRVVSAIRHPRKLKRGSHAGNRFVIVLRDVAGDRDTSERIAESIRRSGLPNYFGEQRFGRNGDNLRLAERLFAGARLGRSERGFALSAARALVFNEVLTRRV
ncbi:MAG: tRNA pseudouridine(13) synthase TruD, partial [Dokdonella sp.]